MLKFKALQRRESDNKTAPAVMEPIINQLDIEKTSAPMILLLGQTGAGKSHFINRVFGEDVEEVRESARLESCTQEPHLVSVKVDNREYFLIDTPGFNDTWKDLKRSDATILGDIAKILTLQTQLGLKLRGILYLYDISQTRMTGDTLRQFELIKRICGKRNYQNVILVTTHWPKHSDEHPQCAVREGELRRNFWKEMVEGGSTMTRFDDKHSTAKTIIRRLAGKEDITLTLQTELASGHGLKKTSAFSFIVNARKKDEEKLAKSGEVEAEGVEIRKEAEGRLNDDIIAKVQSAIEEEEAKARKAKRKANVLTVFRWVLGLAHVAMGATQVGLAV